MGQNMIAERDMLSQNVLIPAAPVNFRDTDKIFFTDGAELLNTRRVRMTFKIAVGHPTLSTANVHDHSLFNLYH